MNKVYFSAQAWCPQMGAKSERGLDTACSSSKEVAMPLQVYIHLKEDEEKSEASINNLANIRIDHKRI